MSNRMHSNICAAQSHVHHAHDGIYIFKFKITLLLLIKYNIN